MVVSEKVLAVTNTVEESIFLSSAYRINAIRHVEAYVVRVVSRRDT